MKSFDHDQENHSTPSLTTLLNHVRVKTRPHRPDSDIQVYAFIIIIIIIIIIIATITLRDPKDSNHCRIILCPLSIGRGQVDVDDEASSSKQNLDKGTQNL